MKFLVPMVVLGILAVATLSGHQATASRTESALAGAVTPDNSQIILAAAPDDSAKGDKAGKAAEKGKTETGKQAAASADNLDRGIGPIKTIKLDSINSDLVEKGRLLFTQKCTVCHQLDTKKIGPPLRDVAKRETPEFIMNMTLNPTGMEAKDPIVKKLISQYQTYMSISGITQDQARALLEYLRWANEQK